MSVSHPKKTRYIAEAKIKSDCVGSKAIAELVRLDALPLAYMLDEETAGLRALVDSCVCVFAVVSTRRFGTVLAIKPPDVDRMGTNILFVNVALCYGERVGSFHGHSSVA